MSEGQAFKYFWILLLIDTLALSTWGFVEVSEELVLWDYVDAGSYVLIVVFGTSFLYYRNGGALGEKFFIRYFPLLWVVEIRFLVFISPLIAIWGVYVWGHEDYPETSTWYETAISLLVSIIFYWRLAKHIGDVAQQGDT